MDTHMMEHMAQVDALFMPSEATHVAVNDGKWTDASTWSTGSVPGDGALVYVPADVAVVYDADSAAELEMVRVDGTLSWSTTQDTSMSVETILTSHGSHLEIGTMDDPIPTDVSAEITFTDGPIDVKVDPGRLSHGLVAFGEVNIHGADKEGHLTMDGGANAGDTSITVSGDLGNWNVGDEILVVGTDKAGKDDSGALITQDETRTIVSVDGNTVTFDKPLQYDHQPPAGHDFDTFVANLSRNVVMRSENPEGTRGHFMMHNGTTDEGDTYANTVVNAEFRDMGRTDHSQEVGTASNPAGRYSIHLHQIGTDPDSATSLIEGNAVSGNPGWGIVQHSSQALINDNVVYDVTGAGIVSEMGDETGMWTGNLVSSVTGPTVDHQVGSEGAAYENQSRVIIQQDNIAANSMIGWNFSGREDFKYGPTREGIWRQMFEREQLQYDPSPLDVAIDHEESPLVEFNNNTSIGTNVGFRVFHRQYSDDTDTMSVVRNFTVWGGGDAVHLDNYASNYEFIDSVWQGSSEGFRIERKTSSVVFNNVEMHDFDTGYVSFGVNHEVVLIDTEFVNVDTKFDLKDLMRNVDDPALRKELINYFQTEHGIDYENPMPKIVDSSKLTPVDAVYFTPDKDADLTIGAGDNSLSITGTITDSVGVRTFNEYSIAKPPNGTGTSKDFAGITVKFANTPSDEQKEFTVDQFLALHGAWQKADGSWVSPVVNWITDRLTGDQHPVIIEIKLEGFSDEKMQSFALTEYPDPGINNPGFEHSFVDGSSSGGHGGHTGGDTGNTGGDTGNTGGDTGNTGGDTGNTGGDTGNTGGDTGNTGGDTGTPSGEVREGAEGADALSGTSGDDRLLGWGGNDTLNGGEGADTLNGGDGDDALNGEDASDLVYAGLGNDSVQGGQGNDEVYGQEGNDILVGDGGADTLMGQDGDDVITGSGQSDLLFGGAGNDFLNGGFGHDRLNGGDGADRFFHLGVADHGSDWVQDYDAAEGDVLLLGDSGADVDDFEVRFAHTTDPTGERAGDDSVAEAFVVHTPSNQIIWALVDGAADSQINLQIGGEVFDLTA